MTRACLFSVLQWVAFTAAWFQLLRPRLDTPALFVFAVVGGLLGVGGVSLAWTLVVRSRERRALARAVAGRPLEDGRFGAAAGTIRPSGLRALTAPFSGRESLAYEYDVYRWKRTGSGRSASRDQEFAYYGYGLVPCAIRTPLAEVRLLGMPQLDDLAPQEPSGGEARQRAAEWFASTAFEEVPRGAVRAAFREAMARITDETSEVRRDVRIGQPLNDATGWTLAERVIAPGEQVCVVGHFDATQGGLVPPPLGSGLTLRVLRGEPAAVARRLRTRMLATGVLGAIGLAAAHAVLVFVASVWEDRHGPGGRTFASRQDKLEWAVEEGRVDVVERLVRKGVDPNRPGTFGALPVHRAKDAATLEAILRAGANPEARDRDGFTPLLLAAGARDSAKVRVLLDRHVDVETETPSGFTALQLTADPQVREALMAAGARDRDAELAAGAPLPPDGGEPWKAALAYLEAIGRGDEDAYLALHASRARATAMTAAAYRDARPSTGRFLVGRVRGDRAVLEAEGPVAGGDYRVIVYLVLEDGAWRVMGSGLRQPDFNPPIPPAERPGRRTEAERSPQVESR